MPARIVPVPIATRVAEGRRGPVSREGLVNMYPEPVEGGGVALHSIPGKKLFLTVAGTPRGQINVNGRNFAVMGETLYEATGGAAVSIGSIEGARLVDMDFDTNDLVIVADARSYAYGLQSGDFSEILDPDFPQAASCASLNQRMIYVRADTGQAFYSETGNARSVDGLSFETAESNPDKLVAVRVLGNQAVLLGSNSTEFFIFTGSSDQPFARSTAAAAIQYGCVSRDSLAYTQGGLAWLARARDSGGVFVAFSQGAGIEQINTHAISSQIERVTDLSSARAIAYAHNGHHFYELTFPGEFTAIYDFSTRLWHQVASGTWPAGMMPKASRDAITFAMHGEKRVVGALGGNLYELSLDSFSEFGAGILRQVTFPPFVPNGPRSSTVHSLELIAERGVGSAEGQGSAPIVELSYSIDQGNNWSPPLPASIGPVGGFDDRFRLRWPALGMGTRFDFQVRCSDPVSFTVLEAFAEIEPHAA